MIKKLFFITSLLLPGFAYAANPTANLPVQIVPAGSAPAVAAAAQAAGFSTLAFNADWTQTMPANWLDCASSDDGQPHMMYQGMLFARSQIPCSAAQQVTDPDFGNLALDMYWQPSFNGTGYDIGAVTTRSLDGSRIQTFPNGYYEVIWRMKTTPAIPGGAGFLDNLSGSIFAAFGNTSAVTPPNSYEPDIVEFWPNQMCRDMAVHDWGNGDSAGYVYNACATSYDSSHYHKWALLITGDGSKHWFCGYIDDVATGCTGFADVASPESTARWFLWLWLGNACNGNTTSSCTNQRISSVSNNGGAIQIHTQSCMALPSNVPRISITGASGSMPINGAWVLTPINYGQCPDGNYGAQDWVLNGSTYTGSYGGAGMVNAYSRLDAFVKSYRVWSCANWQTTMCNGTVLTKAP